MGLLDFPCGRPARDSPPPPAAEAPAPPEREGERRRRVSHAPAPPAWRPSLVAIAEDGVFVVAAAQAPFSKKAPKGEGGSKAKAKPAAAKAVRLAVSDAYRYSGVPTVQVAFGSTPFLF